MKFKGRLKGYAPAQRTHDRNQNRIRKDLFELENDAPEPTSCYYKLAVCNAYHTFKLEEPVKMIHLKEVFDQHLEDWSCSPGLPWRDLGYATKADIRGDVGAVNKIRKYWWLVKRGVTVRPPDCCAYYTRAHAAEKPDWEYPATIAFGEAVFAIPLIRAYTGSQHPSVCCDLKSDNCHFPKLVRTVPLPKWLLEKAFLILMSNINFAYYENYGVPDARYMIRMFDYIKDYFINTTIRLANGERWQKNSGLAIGSYFTHLVGSICNDILLKWACYESEKISISYLLQFGVDSGDIHKHIETRSIVDINKSPEFAQSIAVWSRRVGKTVHLD